MPEIKLKARLQNKYETLEEWNQLVKGEFTPLKGEICYGIDKGVLYQKIGDGITDFVDLPWLLNQSDWLENDKTSPSYVQNRIAYIEVAEGDPILEIKYVNNDGISQPMVVSDNAGIICEGREFAEEDIGKLWSFNLKYTNTDGTNPLEIDIPGPVELKTFGEDDIIYYYGNFYRFYVMYAIMGFQDEIAAGDITVEDIEQMVRDELQIEDTNENYAFVNMFGIIIGAMFGVSLDDPNNFNYEFSLSSYPTIVHKLDSKYLQDVDLVGKFQDIEDYNEIFNDYANHHAQGTYAHIEGKNNRISNTPVAVHIEGCENTAGGNYAHVEGYHNEVGFQGAGAHAEGFHTYAEYYGAHAEGCNTMAFGSSTHAEGSYSAAVTKSWEEAAHAEGKGSYASGVGAHAEGGSSLSAKPDQNGMIREGSYSTVAVSADGRIHISSSVATINPKQIYIISDEISTYITREGYLASGTLAEEIIQSGYLHNVTYQLRMEDFGAAGDYSHVEGYNNTALGNYSHVEGYDNYVSGNTSHVEGTYNDVTADYSHVAGYSNKVSGNHNHVSGSQNKISGLGHFVLGKGLINNGSTNIEEGQIVLGKYNQNVQYADLIIGNGTSDSNRHNELVLQDGNLQVSGLINDGNENDVWKYVSGKDADYRPTYRNYFLEDYNLLPQSQIINTNKIKIQRTAGAKTIKIGNGNLLPLNWIESQTLDNGTSIVLNEDYSVTITAVPSETEQNIQITNVFRDWQVYDNVYAQVIKYYCWDKNIDNEIYYTMDKGQKINDYLWYYEGYDNNPYPLIYITIAPNTNKTITLLPPLVTLNQSPREWVPPMEMIELTGNEIEIELDQNLFKNQIGIGFPSSTGTLGAGQGYSIYYTPKSVINEHRMGIILDNLKEEISTSLILKSPNGTKFNITVNDDGTLSTTQI